MTNERERRERRRQKGAKGENARDRVVSAIASFHEGWGREG